MELLIVLKIQIRILIAFVKIKLSNILNNCRYNWFNQNVAVMFKTTLLAIKALLVQRITLGTKLTLY